MDEYIKREDALDAVLFALAGTGLQSRAISAIRDVNTADVVPKSEYDRMEKLFNDMTQEAKGYLNRLYGIRAEVAREIFEEIEEHFYNNESQTGVLLYEDFAELKKKYTEGESNGSK